jgi:hypothetical protein
MGVQAPAGQADLHPVVVGVRKVLRAEIAADEKMLGNELALHGYGVHGGDLRVTQVFRLKAEVYSFV